MEEKTNFNSGQKSPRCCKCLYVPPLFSCSHPSISCLFPLFPWSPWHPDLQSNFILSPHQSQERSSFFCISVNLSQTHLCIAPSRSPAKALMSYKCFTLSLHPSIFPLLIFSLCPRIVFYLNGLSLSFSHFKISIPL